jgi:hypothetical protein
MVVKLAWFALGLVVAATAFPSFAQSDRTSTARAQAIQDCSAEAGKYSQHLWGLWEVQVYRACMGRHGQKE